MLANNKYAKVRKFDLSSKNILLYIRPRDHNKTIYYIDSVRSFYFFYNKFI